MLIKIVVHPIEYLSGKINFSPIFTVTETFVNYYRRRFGKREFIEKKAESGTELPERARQRLRAPTVLKNFPRRPREHRSSSLNDGRRDVRTTHRYRGIGR